ncbi:GH21085 [Drosophila grimshawi]|uniref:GH21085 n=1 Tax=Drosophila grimshawi TaxID=7222 RepID=B4J5V5_DROGR|nr:GH21085 [Drosophila grimshawi]
MAGTSIVATICAERLTKFLTRYSKAQAGNLRCNMPVESIKQNITSPTVQMAAADRKYLLWQSLAENQFQLPLLEKPKSLDNIYDFTLQRRNIRQQSTSKLLNKQGWASLADFF